MSVHENDKTVSYIPLSGDPTVGSVRVAEEAVKAFKTALRELGEPVPVNDVRAVLTTSGLRLEVTAAHEITVEHYGTPAPVEEIAEFIGDAPAPLAGFRDGDTVRLLRSSRNFLAGDLLTLTRADVDSDGEVFAHRNLDGAYGYVRPEDLEAV